MRFFLTAALCLFLTAASARAQTFFGGEFERSLKPGASVPYDGAPFSHRYNYSTDTLFFYPTLDSRNLMYLEYLDRLDRAEKFGYATPRDPFSREAPGRYYPARTGFGLGFGIFRGR